MKFTLRQKEVINILEKFLPGCTAKYLVEEKLPETNLPIQLGVLIENDIDIEELPKIDGGLWFREVIYRLGTQGILYSTKNGFMYFDFRNDMVIYAYEDRFNDMDMMPYWELYEDVISA